MTHPISEPTSHPQSQPMRSAVERIAAFAATARPGQLKSGIRHLFKRNILDCLGCAIAALPGQPFHALREQFEEYRAPGRCTLIGGGKTSADQAALFNSGLTLPKKENYPYGHTGPSYR
jgi:2-methylcitrate dehydratase